MTISPRNTKQLMFAGALLGMFVAFSRCTPNTTASSGSANLTTAGKITSGLGSATSTMQSLGTALSNSNSTFSTDQQAQSAANSCTSHGDPGSDTNANGTVEDGERYSQNHTNYALQKFYCTLASDTTGPESVSGAVRLIKTVTCAVEKQLGSITFNNTPVAVSGITIDTSCASASMLQDMNNGTPATSVTISVSATITASLNPTFAEFPANTHYSHGLRIASNDGTSLKFIVLAKFDDSIAGDPIQNGDFEFATFGTGSVMQGSGIEYTAGKIDRTSGNAGTLWYESRINRIKANINDAVCNPGQNSSSCGFMRHTRLRTDIVFSGNDISDISNMTGIIAEGYDPTGSGQTADGSFILTATGSLNTGVSGKAWVAANLNRGTDMGISPEDFTVGDNLANATTFPSPVTSCVFSGGSITTTCGAAPAPLQPAGDVTNFFNPPNTTTWLQTLSTNGGLGFTTAASLADTQHP